MSRPEIPLVGNTYAACKALVFQPRERLNGKLWA